MNADAVVLDVDGVLVDVADSYRRAIVESVDRVYGRTVDDAAVQRFKNAGGFNNDWELTYAAALFVLARDAGYEADVAAFTDAIADAGGGLDAAEAVVRDAPVDDAVFDRWDPDRLREVFQALYLGADLYRDLEGGDPPVETAGYIHDEPVLAEAATLDALTDRFAVGILTGRPAAEAAIALDRVGLGARRTPVHDGRLGGGQTPPAGADNARRPTGRDAGGVRGRHPRRRANRGQRRRGRLRPNVPRGRRPHRRTDRRGGAAGLRGRRRRRGDRDGERPPGPAGPAVTPDWSRFAAVAAVLLVVVVAVVAATTPPDPSTQLRGVVPGIVAALVVAYLVAVGGE
jgi:HAD superfamily hydrolase (TIGR01548 family)